GAAVLALRDGASSLARKGDRVGAIALLKEAAGIAPGDLAAHRRLAAAHANAGDAPSACAEYERYVDYALAEGDNRRAWLELTYARETLGDLPGLVRLVDRLVPGAAAPVVVQPPPVQPVAVEPAGAPPAAPPTAPPRGSPPGSSNRPAPPPPRLQQSGGSCRRTCRPRRSSSS